MWLGEVDFDGRFVSGVLLNAPNWLKTVKAGDSVRVPLDQITDWMYAIFGDVYGAYTVNLKRSRMNQRERAEHDGAWGLNFGDPHRICAVPEPKKPGGPSDTDTQEHPLSEGAAASLRDQLVKDPSVVRAKDDRGWTLLHHQALAGSAATVTVLLECGADTNAVTDHGMTPLQLARSLGWEKVVALLGQR
jgi:hypothetical protein